MRKSYFIAALLCLAAAVIRTVDGESQILVVARNEIATPALLGFVHLTWYLVTAVFALSSLALFRLARRPDAYSSALPRFLGWLFLVWSGIIASIGMTFGWHAGTIIPAVITALIGWSCLTTKGRESERATRDHAVPAQIR